MHIADLKLAYLLPAHSNTEFRFCPVCVCVCVCPHRDNLYVGWVWAALAQGNQSPIYRNKNTHTHTNTEEGLDDLVCPCQDLSKQTFSLSSQITTHTETHTHTHGYTHNYRVSHLNVTECHLSVRMYKMIELLANVPLVMGQQGGIQVHKC